jgi:predicted TIM-barrel fold metal-dependent hydrolase
MTVGQLSHPNPVPQAKNLYDRVFGRVRDVDTHEMFPARLWTKEYGEQFAPVVEFYLESQSEHIPNSFVVQKIVDDEPMTESLVESSWSQGCLAASAFDMNRRLEFMDIAGIDDCLLFGSAMHFIGVQLACSTARFEQQRGKPLPFDGTSMGIAMVAAHNDWCIRTAKISPRLRPVAAIITNSLAGALDEIKRVFQGGVRAIFLTYGNTIEGKAPAHPDNDVLWGFCADNDIAVMLHVGGERGLFREATEWTNAPQFAHNDTVPMEMAVDPFSMATSSIGGQYYLTNLVLGGVFERFPKLRFGAAELGANWIGPTAEGMDMWANEMPKRMAKILTMPPSEYVRRNVRVSPFTFEPVNKYLERYPFLEDVLCFSTDFPHFEGGKNPQGVVAGLMQSFGPEVFEKLFVTNAGWLMPRV